MPIGRFMSSAYSGVTPVTKMRSVPPATRTRRRFVARGRKASTPS